MEKDKKQLSFTIGSTTINVTTSRMENLLSRQDFDAVVSSDDTHLTMSGGLSGAIARLAGKEILSEIAALVPLPMGAVAVTGAGHLRARFIFHAVTVDRHNNVLATERTLRQLGRQIFVRCEALKVRRAAVPLATGTSGFSAADSARIVLECLPDVVRRRREVRWATRNERLWRKIGMPLLESQLVVGAARNEQGDRGEREQGVSHRRPSLVSQS